MNERIEIDLITKEKILPSLYYVANSASEIETSLLKVNSMDKIYSTVISVSVWVFNVRLFVVYSSYIYTPPVLRSFIDS